MNELKHKIVELLNRYNLTISEFDELISFMQELKSKSKLTFEFNQDNIAKLEVNIYVTNCDDDLRPLTEKVWLL